MTNSFPALDFTIPQRDHAAALPFLSFLPNLPLTELAISLAFLILLFRA